MYQNTCVNQGQYSHLSQTFRKGARMTGNIYWRAGEALKTCLWMQAKRKGQSSFLVIGWY